MIKKYFSIGCFILLIISFSNCYASSNITYFYGEALKIENDGVRILSNEVKINTTTSKIENIVLIKNETLKDI